MNELADNVAEVEKRVARDKGSFNLFALFEREDVSNRYDLVFAAPWASDKGEVLRYFVVELKQHVPPEQLVSLSRVVVLDPSDEAVRAINSAFHVEHGRMEVTNSNVFGLPIKHGLIFTSQRAA
ncbi:MAG TPA: hypothetical protein VNM92_18115 [Thermoanaerobaculia bacterium]|nr:hypothetical protein [Thermoanaerobaculia bacterium]